MIWSAKGGSKILLKFEGVLINSVFLTGTRVCKTNGRSIMKKISDRGESKGMLAVVMVAGLWFGLIAVFDHISMLQNHWMGSW